jgi:hypothetical protein
MASTEATVSSSASSPGGLPVAQRVHLLRRRVRIRLERGRRPGVDYDRIATTLEQRLPEVRVRCSPVTDSIVLSGPPAAIDQIGPVAEQAGLFRLQAPAPSLAPPLAVQMTQPVGKLSGYLERATRGKVNLPGMVFLSALLLGLYELARGNFRTPPWYTAFWYAFGVYSKSLMDRRAEAQNPPEES